MRNVQHKKEAYWFYRFLSIVYDDYVNPFFWTPRMRDEALALADLDRADLKVVDVGSGTGFTTQGIVRYVDAAGVTCLDQSPHQMAYARRKPELQACTFLLGDAEDLPFPTDHFDRYISAGSIEYWPEPERGIVEAYRVLKPGGRALMIGPLRPRHPAARAAADAWMLFPEEEEYVLWFKGTGFTDLQWRYIAPSWVTREKYGIALAGTKPTAGVSALAAVLPPKQEDVQEPMSAVRALAFARRLLVGSLAGFVFIPAALIGHANAWIRHRQGLSRAENPSEPGLPVPPPPDPLTLKQTAGVAALLVGALWVITRLFRRNCR